MTFIPFEGKKKGDWHNTVVLIYVHISSLILPLHKYKAEEQFAPPYVFSS